MTVNARLLAMLRDETERRRATVELGLPESHWHTSPIDLYLETRGMLEEVRERMSK